jgi:hypothetical protein
MTAFTPPPGLCRDQPGFDSDYNDIMELRDGHKAAMHGPQDKIKNAAVIKTPRIGPRRNEDRFG